VSGDFPARAAAAAEIVVVCRRLYERGLIAGGEGNVTVRLGPNRVLATPAGLSKVDVSELDLVEVALDGQQLGGTRRASTEIAMHLRVYARRPEVRAVVHAHPPTATGFAVAGEDFMAAVLPEVIFGLGPVPLVPYGQPGTRELADRLEPFVADHDVFLLANHGATACGPTLALAHQRMESLEQAARIMLAARLLGRVTPLAPEQVQALLAARARDAAGQAPAHVEGE
jgi:L-fuculose-phosphate aldolase